MEDRGLPEGFEGADEEKEEEKKDPQKERRETTPEENRKLAEAALFISGRGLSVKELLKAVPVLTPAKARNALESLVERSDSESALEVSREVGAEIRYKMKVKDAYLSQVRRLSNFTDLSEGETKTLAVVAFYQPIKQSEIVKIRGNRAYEQVKNLVGAGLVVSEPRGITKILRTTERFSDYFGAPLESLRGKLDAKDKAIIDGAVEKAREEVEISEAPVSLKSPEENEGNIGGEIAGIKEAEGGNEKPLSLPETAEEAAEESFKEGSEDSFGGSGEPEGNLKGEEK